MPLNPAYDWYNTDEAANYYGRTPRTIRRWCNDGTLVDAGCATYNFSGHWLIGMPRQIPPTPRPPADMTV